MEKLEKRQRLLAQNNKVLAEQFKETKERLIKEYVKEAQEGQLIKLKAEEEELNKEYHFLPTRKLKQELKAKQQKLLQEQYDFIEAKKRLQESQVLAEEREEKLRREHEESKYKVMEMRKERVSTI